MRFAAFLGSMLAVAMGGVSMSTVNTNMPDGRFVEFGLRELPSAPARGERPSRPSRIQAHTGAGGAGMHRAAKRRRASGRA